AQQRLVELALDLRLARARLDDEPARARELLDAALGDLEEATRELRELAHGIHPAALSEAGLRPALEALVARSSIPARLVAVPDGRFAAPVEATAYFTVAEGLTNAARHAAAKRVEVEAVRLDGRMPPDNTDDGLRAALTIREELPEVAIVLLSQYVEDRYLARLLARGAGGVGYLLKNRVADVERLSEAVERVADGGSVLDPEV